MTQIHRFSERVIDLAERLEDMTDAANGKGRRGAKASTRFIILPAAGAVVRLRQERVCRARDQGRRERCQDAGIGVAERSHEERAPDDEVSKLESERGPAPYPNEVDSEVELQPQGHVLRALTA